MFFLLLCKIKKVPSFLCSKWEIIRVMENLEIDEILLFHFPDLESHGIFMESHAK